jgi:hypothetical protein
MYLIIQPFGRIFSLFAQSPEPHPYTQPKRTAKVVEKSLKQKAGKQNAESFSESWKRFSEDLTSIN